PRELRFAKRFSGSVMSSYRGRIQRCVGLELEGIEPSGLGAKAEPAQPGTSPFRRAYRGRATGHHSAAPTPLELKVAVPVGASQGYRPGPLLFFLHVPSFASGLR